VKDAGVIGVPNERAGEVPLAFVVKQPNEDVCEEELVRYIAGNVGTMLVKCSRVEEYYFRKCLCPEASIWWGTIY
jgi:acyl-coenzyme A synthetase/AMP-(fatty) acid ligase